MLPSSLFEVGWLGREASSRALQSSRRHNYTKEKWGVAMDWKQKIHDHWHDVVVYAFTVVCVFLGRYILDGTRPELEWLAVTASLVVALIICLAVDVLSGAMDTATSKLGKRKRFPKRMLVSALAGVASSAVIPALIRFMFRPVGVDF